MESKNYTPFEKKICFSKILFFFPLLLWKCSTGDQQIAQNQLPPSGEKVFKQYCVACHGIDGKLGLNGAKDFTQSTLTLPERVKIISEGKGVMTPFRAILSPEEIEAVANYTLRLSEQK